MVTSFVCPWGQLASLRAFDDDLARACFDTPTSYVIGGPIPTYATTPVRLFRSFSSYQASRPAPGVVCLDLERWEGSDEIEQRDPPLTFRMFAAEAKLRGNLLINAPGRDLVYCPGAIHGGILPGEDINDAYLRCRIPGAACDAAVLLVQAQGAQKDLDAFTGLIEGARAQQPANQYLWAGLTTGQSTADQILAAATAVAGVVSGFWVTIGSPAQAPVAAEFFRGWLAWQQDASRPAPS